MTPPEVYIAVFRLENGNTMPVLSSPTAFRLFQLDRLAYADKRLKRFNNKRRRIARNGGLKRIDAIDFTMEKYVRSA